MENLLISYTMLNNNKWQKIMTSLCLMQTKHVCVMLIQTLPSSCENEPNGEGRERTVTLNALSNITKEFNFTITS